MADQVKRAIQRLVRGDDGQTRIVLIDLDTLEEITDMTGYRLVSQGELVPEPVATVEEPDVPSEKFIRNSRGQIVPRSGASDASSANKNPVIRGMLPSAPVAPAPVTRTPSIKTTPAEVAVQNSPIEPSPAKEVSTTPNRSRSPGPVETGIGGVATRQGSVLPSLDYDRFSGNKSFKAARPQDSVLYTPESKAIGGVAPTIDSNTPQGRPSTTAVSAYAGATHRPNEPTTGYKDKVGGGVMTIGELAQRAVQDTLGPDYSAVGTSGQENPGEQYGSERHGTGVASDWHIENTVTKQVVNNPQVMQSVLTRMAYLEPEVSIGYDPTTPKKENDPNAYMGPTAAHTDVTGIRYGPQENNISQLQTEYGPLAPGQAWGAQESYRGLEPSVANAIALGYYNNVNNKVMTPEYAFQAPTPNPARMPATIQDAALSVHTSPFGSPLSGLVLGDTVNRAASATASAPGYTGYGPTGGPSISAPSSTPSIGLYGRDAYTAPSIFDSPAKNNENYTGYGPTGGPVSKGIISEAKAPQGVNERMFDPAFTKPSTPAEAFQNGQWSIDPKSPNYDPGLAAWADKWSESAAGELSRKSQDAIAAGPTHPGWNDAMAEFAGMTNAALNGEVSLKNSNDKSRIQSIEAPQTAGNYAKFGDALKNAMMEMNNPYAATVPAGLVNATHYYMEYARPEWANTAVAVQEPYAPYAHTVMAMNTAGYPGDPGYATPKDFELGYSYLDGFNGNTGGIAPSYTGSGFVGLTNRDGSINSGAYRSAYDTPSEGGSRFGGSGLGYSGNGGYDSPSEGGSRFGGSGLGSPVGSSRGDSPSEGGSRFGGSGLGSSGGGTSRSSGGSSTGGSYSGGGPTGGGSYSGGYTGGGPTGGGSTSSGSGGYDSVGTPSNNDSSFGGPR